MLRVSRSEKLDLHSDLLAATPKGCSHRNTSAIAVFLIARVREGKAQISRQIFPTGGAVWKFKRQLIIGKHVATNHACLLIHSWQREGNCPRKKLKGWDVGQSINILCLYLF